MLYWLNQSVNGLNVDAAIEVWEDGTMRSFLRLRWTCLAVVMAVFPASASAQATAALMPRIGGDEAVGPEAQAAAREAATSVLREEGLLLIEALQIESQLDDAERRCLPAAPCVENVFRHAGVEVLVGLVLTGSVGSVQRVWVYVVRANGVREGVAAVEGELADAISDALRPLLDQAPAAGGPNLQIEGTTGAHVSVDDEPVGDVPVVHPTTAGEHVVAAELAGYLPRRVRVTLPDDPNRTVTVDLQLPREEPPLHWGVVVGISAIALGAGAGALPPAISYVSAGCTDMGCTEFEEVDDIVWIWTAVGAAVTGAGIGVLIWGLSQGDASVEARLLPNGARLEGRF